VRAVRPRAGANHVVYAGMRDTVGHTAESAAVATRYGGAHGVTLCAIDAVVHSADQVVLGNTEDGA
jgi:hypothetical protein